MEKRKAVITPERMTEIAQAIRLGPAQSFMVLISPPTQGEFEEMAEIALGAMRLRKAAQDVVDMDNRVRQSNKNLTWRLGMLLTTTYALRAALGEEA